MSIRRDGGAGDFFLKLLTTHWAFALTRIGLKPVVDTVGVEAVGASPDA